MNAGSSPIAERFTGLVGIAFSRARRRIRWRTVAWGLGLQVGLAIFVLRVPAGRALFRGALAPERKHGLARLGVRAMLAGTLANFLSATIAGMLL